MSQELNATPTLPDSLWKNATPGDTWDHIVRQVLALRGPVGLPQLYSAIESHPKVVNREHWKAKCRQVLQRNPDYARVAKGTWDLSARYSAEEVERFEASRREQYPRGVKSEE